jgi:hypothetical protein
MARGKDKRVEEACKEVWREHRTGLKNKTITVTSVWENHIPTALGTYPIRLWPKDSWFTKRVSKWEAETLYEDIPTDPIVKPWSKHWGEDSSQISVLTALFGHAQEVLEGQDENYRLEGLPKRVCAWAIRLSEFFDIGLTRECLYLLSYAYRFEKEERIRLISPDPSEDKIISHQSFEDLIRWQQHKAGNLVRPKRKYKQRTYENWQNTSPLPEPTIIEIEETYIWERAEDDLEISLAFDVRGATGFRDDGDGGADLLVDGKWIPISIKPRYQENDRPITPQQVSPSSDVVPNKLVEVLRAQGFPIDEDHAGLGMAYTNPPEQEESQEGREPAYLPREEYTEPPALIAEAFAETFAQSRERIAKEEAEEDESPVAQEELLDGAYRVIGETTTHQMIMPVEASATGDSQIALTQDAASKLVAELLEDPGTLSRERAAELGMELVATFDEILNRHVGKQEGEKN